MKYSVTFLKITYLSGGLFLYAVGQVAPGVIRSALPGSEQEPEECDATKPDSSIAARYIKRLLNIVLITI
jgi:hypothetical protein